MLTKNQKLHLAYVAAYLLCKKPKSGPWSSGCCWAFDPYDDGNDLSKEAAESFVNFFDKEEWSWWWPLNKNSGPDILDCRLFALAMWAVIPMEDLA